MRCAPLRHQEDALDRIYSEDAPHRTIEWLNDSASPGASMKSISIFQKA